MSVNLRTVYAFAREMYPKLNDTLIEYGTAGFRGNANDLYSCMYRMGVLATLRSRFFAGEVIGVMITASHNPEPDNGVKLIDPRGEMLESSWEVIATRLANISDNEIEEEVARIIKTCGINIGSPSNVFVGMDNRYHSPRLLKAVSDGVIALKGNVREFGIVTTPMMHYFVVAANTKGAYGQPTEEGYYFKLITAFEKVFKMSNDNKNYKNKIIFDGANGVGALKILQFLKRMNGSLEIDVFNKGDGKINEGCGSDYVKINQCIPKGITIAPFVRCVSVDGDADRLVYYFLDSSNNFCLLDGDRISILISTYLIELVRNCNLQLSLGVVQTAYANGASTEYIKNQLEIPVACVPTGVKHLHHKAMEFDIGVYFEANGHGTVVFSQKAKTQILHMSDQNISASKLLTIIDLINETVGDSISDMLLVETILQNKDWDVKEWYATYTDLPNTQLKVKVPDRNVIKTTDAERICVEPKGLQDAINAVVLKFAHGRAFARPSGTENIVRVYAEAATKEEANVLAHEVGDAIQMFCGVITENVTQMKTANHL